MESFKTAIDKVSFLTKEESDEINERIDKMRELIPNYEWQKDYPHLSRDCGGDILNRIVFKGVTKIQNSLEFAADSIFCEWAYVIDLDTNKFEIYRGFNEEKLSENERFYFLEDKSEGEYHPVKFVKAYNICNLPEEKEFIADLTPDDEGED